MDNELIGALDASVPTQDEIQAIRARMEAKGLTVEPLNHGRPIDYLFVLLDRTCERLSSETAIP